MSLDLTWLFGLVSHPLFISILSAIVGGLVTYFLYIKQMNWQATTKHFEDLKTQAIEPMLQRLNGMKWSSDGRNMDDSLQTDLFEHYPELFAMMHDGYELEKEKEKKEKAFLDKIDTRVEASLIKAEITFQKEYEPIIDVCFSKHITEYVYGILENKKWYASFLIEHDSSEGIFKVKIDGTEVFQTLDKMKAEKVKDKLDIIVRNLVVDSDLNEKMQRVEELRYKIWASREDLKEKLGELKNKTKLKLKKKFGIFPRPCKYLKP
jgi:hypothetical protein